jgi:uncharacterized protein (DUF1778 family)
VLEKLELAASISGATMNQFITQASLEKAEKVVENERLWQLSDETTKWLLELLDTPPAPTPQLIEVMNNDRQRRTINGDVVTIVADSAVERHA